MDSWIFTKYVIFGRDGTLSKSLREAVIVFGVCQNLLVTSIPGVTAYLYVGDTHSTLFFDEHLNYFFSKSPKIYSLTHFASHCRRVLVTGV